MNDVREICSDFLSVGVSGMNSDTLRCGRPYGGCSILYRKSLSSCISLLQSNSDRFCGIRLCDSSGLSYLLVSVYMPTYYDPSCVDVYLNVLGELEGFIASQGCDVNIIAGDFNVDFDRGGQFAKLLKDFMAGLDLHACDLNFRSSVNYTYERDDCVTQSWLDHVLCSQKFSTHISDIHAVHSASITSDHFPLFFNITVSCKLVPHIRSPTVRRPPRTAWSKVSSADIDRYCHLVSCSITTLPSQTYSCVTPNCTEHNHSLDSFARNFLSTLLDCARQCFPQHSSSPRRLVCWNDTSCSKLKQTANFWYRLWEDAGHPSSGVLFQIKKNTKTRYKYEIRRLKRRQNVLLQDKFASLFASKNESTKVQNPRRNSYAVSSSYGAMHIRVLFIYCACAYECLAAPSRPSPVSRLFHAGCTSS